MADDARMLGSCPARPLSFDGSDRPALPTTVADKLRAPEARACALPLRAELAVNVPYHKLEAFPASPQRGWGVRCTAPITQGQVVVEVRGRCLSELEYEELSDPSYVVSFDDKLLQLKRAMQDDVMYIDLRQYGNMMRLINDCNEAPNLQLMCALPGVPGHHCLACMRAHVPRVSHISHVHKLNM